jgi:hypothetical protein
MLFLNLNAVQPSTKKEFNYKSWSFSNKLSVDDDQLTQDLAEHFAFSEDVDNTNVEIFWPLSLALNSNVTATTSKVKGESLGVIGFINSDTIALKNQKLISLINNQLNSTVNVTQNNTTSTLTSVVQLSNSINNSHSTDKLSDVALGIGLNLDQITLIFEFNNGDIYLTFSPLGINTNSYIIGTKTVFKDTSTLINSVNSDITNNTVRPASVTLDLRMNHSLELLKGRFIAANIALVESGVISQQFSERLIETSVNLGLFTGVLDGGLIGDDNMIFELLTIYSICKWSINDLDTPVIFDINPNVNINSNV